MAPGTIWLALFFLVPLVTLARIALSTKPNQYLPSYEFTWAFSNFSDAISDNWDILIRSFG